MAKCRLPILLGKIQKQSTFYGNQKQKDITWQISPLLAVHFWTKVIALGSNLNKKVKFQILFSKSSFGFKIAYYSHNNERIRNLK